MIRLMEMRNKELRMKRKLLRVSRANRIPLFVVNSEKQKRELERARRVLKYVCRRILNKPNTALLIYSNIKRRGRHVVWMK